MTIRSKYFILLLGFAFACSFGCGGSGNPVEGKVTLDGQPMSGVHVAFFPAGASVNDPTLFRGVTDEDGSYILINPIDNEIGAPAGRYRVSLTTAVAGPNDDETTPLPPERVPAKYRDGSLQFEVPAGGTTEANFELKSR